MQVELRDVVVQCHGVHVFVPLREVEHVEETLVSLLEEPRHGLDVVQVLLRLRRAVMYLPAHIELGRDLGDVQRAATPASAAPSAVPASVSAFDTCSICCLQHLHVEPARMFVALLQFLFFFFFFFFFFKSDPSRSRLESQEPRDVPLDVPQPRPV